LAEVPQKDYVHLLKTLNIRKLPERKINIISTFPQKSLQLSWASLFCRWKGQWRPYMQHRKLSDLSFNNSQKSPLVTYSQTTKLYTWSVLDDSII